jgi:hypothetical protein
MRGVVTVRLGESFIWREDWTRQTVVKYERGHRESNTMYKPRV